MSSVRGQRPAHVGTWHRIVRVAFVVLAGAAGASCRSGPSGTTPATSAGGQSVAKPRLEMFALFEDSPDSEDVRDFLLLVWDDGFVAWLGDRASPAGDAVLLWTGTYPVEVVRETAAVVSGLDLFRSPIQGTSVPHNSTVYLGARVDGRLVERYWDEWVWPGVGRMTDPSPEANAEYAAFASQWMTARVRITYFANDVDTTKDIEANARVEREVLGRTGAASLYKVLHGPAWWRGE